MVFLLCFLSNLKGFTLWGVEFLFFNSTYWVLMNTVALLSDFFCAKPLMMVKFLPGEVNLRLLFCGLEAVCQFIPSTVTIICILQNEIRGCPLNVDTVCT